MTTIYVRISLLTIATVMFGLIWSLDDRPVEQQKTVVTYALDQPCRVGTREPVIETIAWELLTEKPLTLTPFETLPAEATPSLLATTADSADADIPPAAEPGSVVEVSAVNYPLPYNLTTGEYRVVDQFGQVETLVVNENDLRSWGLEAVDNVEPTEIRNAYEVCQGEKRWHIIRVEPRETAFPSAERLESEQLAAAWDAVFQTAGNLMEPAIDRIASPLNRWLKPGTEISAEPRELQ